MKHLHNFILAYEFTNCEDEFKNHCLHFKSSNNCRLNLNRCMFPLRANPLCFCSDINRCPRRYEVIQSDNKTYILYSCKGCDNFINSCDTDNNIKLLNSIHAKELYYGKDLTKLVKSLNIEEHDPDFNNLLMFWEHIYSLVNTERSS